jgi:hypothetical protein
MQNAHPLPTHTTELAKPPAGPQRFLAVFNRVCERFRLARGRDARTDEVTGSA